VRYQYVELEKGLVRGAVFLVIVTAFSVLGHMARTQIGYVAKSE